MISFYFILIYKIISIYAIDKCLIIRNKSKMQKPDKESEK